MAARTVRSSSGLTGVEPRTTRETVDGETPARRATSLSVGRRLRSGLMATSSTRDRRSPGDAVRPRDAGEPAGAVLRGALLRGVVDVHEPEPARVPPRPLEVVHQRPHEVAAQVDAVGDRPRRRPEVADEEVDALLVAHPPVGVDDV